MHLREGQNQAFLDLPSHRHDSLSQSPAHPPEPENYSKPDQLQEFRQRIRNRLNPTLPA